MVGKTISHYKITEQLGVGGMGIVYKAEDTRLHRTVALKFLPTNFSIDAEAKTRFIREAQAASALQHKNICTIHEIDETDDGQLFICMDFYSGETLKDKIKTHSEPGRREQRINIKETLDIILQIAQGLASAHEAGEIHRDIKPANIMITEKGEVKIVDFGLAKFTGQTQLTQIGTTVGTISYMSPEQASGLEVDHRTDIWSLGVVFYETLTGRLPFRGEYDQAVIYGIIHEEPEKPSQINPAVPPELEQIILKMLAKDPADRYQRMEEIIEDLISFKEGAYRPKKVRRPQKKLYLWLTSLSLITIISAIILFYPSESIPFSAKDWILITDFENHTNENELEKSLYTAFSLSIDQSEYVNVFPKRRIIETLKRMEQENLPFVNEETGREIAIREGINIFVVPSIGKVGDKYILTGKIYGVKEDKILKSEILYADTQNDILDKLDELSNQIRKDLGETRFSILRRSRPLSEVTTSSLKALQQYTLGIEQHCHSNFQLAKKYYESALQIDSNFTAAKVSLGSLLYEKFDRDKGRELLKQAIKSVDRLPEKEKYAILAFYEANVKEDLIKAIEYLKMRIKLDPNDPSSHHNLGWYYQNTERYALALKEYKKTIELNPYYMLSYGGIIWIYLEKTGQIDSAYAWTKQMLSVDENNYWGYFYLGSVYVWKDSLEKAEQAFKKTYTLYPYFLFNTYRLAHVYRLQKKYDKAIQVLTNMLQYYKNEASIYYDLGVNYQISGNERAAREYFIQFNKFAEKWFNENPNDAASCIALGVVLSRLDEKQRGWEIGSKAFELDSTLHLRFAELLTVQGKKEEALVQLKKALNNGFRDYVRIKINPDLQALQSEVAYKSLIKKYFFN